jgi:hypothetical protein
MALLAQVSTQTLLVSGKSFLNGDVEISGVLTNGVKSVFSTLGFDDMFIQVNDISTKFLLEGSNFPQNIVLPDLASVSSNWNVTLNNQFTSFTSFQLLDINSNVIGPSLNPGQTVTAVAPDGTRWYFY